MDAAYLQMAAYVQIQAAYKSQEGLNDANPGLHSCVARVRAEDQHLAEDLTEGLESARNKVTSSSVCTLTRGQARTETFQDSSSKRDISEGGSKKRSPLGFNSSRQRAIAV